MKTERAIVIGSGFGGLAAAVRLRARGYQVTLLEANEQFGGRASVFRQDGFVFDAGPTVITAPYLLEELFACVGRDSRDYFSLMPVDPFYRIKFPDGSCFDYSGDEDQLIAEIRRLAPGDVEGYRKLADMSRRIFEVGYEQLADQPFDRLSDMLRVVPAMLRLKSYRSVYGLVASYLKDERLRQVFSFQPLLVGGNPFRTPSIYLLIHWLERKWGVHFPKGGTGAIVAGLVRLLTELGVELRLSAAVRRIEVQAGRAVGVELENGERLACDLLVSNADPSIVYTRMLDARLRKKNTDRRVSRVRQSMSLFVGYFGTRGQWPDTAHHTILLGPRYKQLLEDIFERKVLADDFSLYLHAPCRSDPGMAPEGHESFYVLSPVPNLLAGIDWQQRADAYFDKIIEHLDATELPGLKERLVTRLSIDPRTFAGRLRSAHGAAFGPEPRLTQSAWFRYHNRCDDVEGLYFVGAGVHPGAGLPGVLCSARVLERLVPPARSPLPLPAPGLQV